MNPYVSRIVLAILHLTDYEEVGISGTSDLYKNTKVQYIEIPLSGKCCIFLLRGHFALIDENKWVGGKQEAEFVGYDVDGSSVLYLYGDSAVSVTYMTG
jgi:hypothetical protein